MEGPVPRNNLRRPDFGLGQPLALWRESQETRRREVGYFGFKVAHFRRKVSDPNRDVPSVQAERRSARATTSRPDGRMTLLFVHSAKTACGTISYFACASFVTTAASLSRIWFQPSS